VALRLEPAGAPPWIRPGLVGRLSLVGIGGAHTVVDMIKRRDVAPIKRQVLALRRRLAG